MEKFKPTPLEKSWILYDVGNSAFILMVTTLVPIYFNRIASAAGLSASEYLANWGYAGSIATLLVAVTAPFLGSLADRKNTKKPVFLTALLLGVAGCSCLGLPLSWVSFLVLFVITRASYASSLVFYDAMLPEITTRERMDQVSSHGYAYGYIGSCIPFILCLLLVLFHGQLGITQNTAMAVSFLITALWWGTVTIPLLKQYRQTAFSQVHENALTDSFVKLWGTVKKAAKNKCVLRFMVGFFFYIDGVYTIINMATAYGTALGLNATGLLLALLVTQFVAFPSSIAFGRLSRRCNTGRLIRISILAYTGITVYAVFLTYQWQFWIMAVCVGLFQGGIQALSRSYFAKIIPPERSGEFFGLFDICGKGASFLGTFLVSLISHLTGRENLGVGILVFLFLIGLALFNRADRLFLSVRSDSRPIAV